MTIRNNIVATLERLGVPIERRTAAANAFAAARIGAADGEELDSAIARWLSRNTAFAGAVGLGGTRSEREAAIAARFPELVGADGAKARRA